MKTSARSILRVLNILAAILTTVTLILCALYTARKPLVTELLSRQLQEQGITAQFELATLAPSHATLRHLSLGEQKPLQIQEVTMRWQWPDIRHGWVEVVEIKGGNLRLDMEKSEEWRASLGLPPAGEQSDAAIPLIPARHILLHPFTLELAALTETHHMVLSAQWDNGAAKATLKAIEPTGGLPAWLLQAEGTLDKSGHWQATAKADPTPLAVLLPLASLVGVGAMPVQVLDGTITFALQARPQSATGNIQLEAVALESQGVMVTGLSSNLQLQSVWPLKTAADQPLSISRIDAALPLEDLSARVGFDGEVLSVNNLKFQMANGQVTMDAMRIRTQKPLPVKARLHLKNVEIAPLLSLANIPDLAVEGTISGAIPLTWTDQGPVFEDEGLVASVGGGRIAYTPASGAGTALGQDAGGEIALKALKNLRYKDLSMSVQTREPNALSLGVHLNGNNPDFYDGFPVELNLNLTLHYADLITHGLPLLQMFDRLGAE